MRRMGEGGGGRGGGAEQPSGALEVSGEASGLLYGRHTAHSSAC